MMRVNHEDAADCADRRPWGNVVCTLKCVCMCSIESEFIRDCAAYFVTTASFIVPMHQCSHPQSLDSFTSRVLYPLVSLTVTKH